MGIKTWCRYEAGGSIRADKFKGICKTLNWRNFPLDEGQEKKLAEDYEKYEAWSKFLADNFGTAAAISFAVGSDILLDYIDQDMEELSSMPSGSHIGQVSTSFIKDELPAQFLMRYDYNFLYQMRCALIQLRNRAGTGSTLTAHTVMEELLIYLCNIEAKAYAEICGSEEILDEAEEFDYYEDWVFELFGDMDIVTFLYSDWNLDVESEYHFDNWNEPQFYTK